MKTSKIKEYAILENIQVFQPKNSKEIFSKLSKHNIDLNLVFAFGMILKTEVLNYPKYKSLNIHTSILPKYRGASPIAEAILNGDKETGISIMKMDEEMDHGNILQTLKLKIKKSEKTNDLSEKMSKIVSDNIIKVLNKFFDNKLTEKEQDHLKATYCTKHYDIDAIIDFNQESEKVLNKIRAFDSNPKAHFFLKDGKKLIINTATESEKILKPFQIEIENKKLYIGTQTKAIEIIELTLEGKKQLNTKEFLNGYSKLFY